MIPAETGRDRPGQERLAFLGMLAGGLAHEIKNPLSTMTITLGLLREDLEGLRGESAEKSLRRVRVLEREVARLEQILHDFLQFAGRHHLERRSTDLNGLVAEVLDFVTPAALEKKVEVRRHLDPSLPPVPLDRDRVKQALLNLVINAQEAMTGRGELLVQTSARGGAVRLDVTDTGPGIEPGVFARIWDAYYSTKKRGTGLGLPIARRIVEEHGGILEVFTEVGKGTRFTMWFPVEAPAPPSGDEKPRPAPAVVREAGA